MDRPDPRGLAPVRRAPENLYCRQLGAGSCQLPDRPRRVCLEKRVVMPSRWVHEHRFPDRQALAAALAGEMKVDLEEAIAARGAASLVAPGGRTPARLFTRLRDEKVDWTRTWITLADERWVETSAEASNERFV